MKVPNNRNSARRRVATKHRAVKHAEAAQEILAGFDPDFIAKLRLDCLRAANTRLAGSDPDTVVREAQRDFDARIRFLTEKRS
jgi:hypothetical protein